MEKEKVPDFEAARPIVCSHCGKEMNYGDENTPVINQGLWRQILDKFGISPEEEERKSWAATKIYQAWKVATPEGKEVLGPLLDHPAFHIFLCTSCMEGALGRKLNEGDLARRSNDGKDLPINRKFLEKLRGGED